jgi:hypothetical protein
MRYTLLLLTVVLLTRLGGLSQTLASANAVTPSASSARQTVAASRDLVPLSSVTADYVNAGMFLYPLRCDGGGNLYLRNVNSGVPAIHELSPNGKQIALFQPDLATSEFKVVRGTYFSLDKDGYLAQLVESKEIKRHVFIFKADGSLKNDIKLETSFPWIPSQVAAFPSGNLLVSGSEYDHDRKNPIKWPFTGVFGLDGSLVKEVKLEDDDMIHDMAAVGDSRVTAPESPNSNYAVALGQLGSASDGNVYLMRRLSPAILYAISSDGRVIRRFTVDVGRPDYMPEDMYIAGNKIAIQFVESQNGDQLIRIVDLEGNEKATYHVDQKSSLGYALSCFQTDPERFTFLGVSKDHMLTLNVAVPK